MVRWIQAIGASVVLLTLYLAVSAQTAAPYPVLFLADYCSDSSAWNGMLRNLPRHRFGDELIRVYQGADGAVHTRGGERLPTGSPSFALDFHDPAVRSFDARTVAAIPIPRKVEQVRAAIDYILGSTGHSHVVVVAHGMGGLVARAYVQGRGINAKATVIPYRSDVAALITIDTPHAGVAIRNPPSDWDAECAAADTVNRREMLPRESAFLQDVNRQPWPSATRLDAIATYYLGPDGDTDGVVPRTSQDLGSLSAYWERHPDVHVWPQRVLEDSRAAPGGTVLHTTVIQSPVTAALVNGIVEEVDRAQDASVVGPLDHLEPHIESPHPYPNNYDNEWTWTAAGNPSALDVTFDAQTWVEDNFDFIRVTDGTGTNVPGSPFTGASLAGRTIRVPGSTLRVRLTTDFSVTGYGFRLTGLTAVSSGFPESPHPYSDNLDRTWSYTAPGNPAAIDVSFDPQTWVEPNFDYIYVMDAAGGSASGSPFTGTGLAGRTVRVRGSTVRVRLTSDASVTGYGFRITNVAETLDAPTTPTWTLSGNVRDAQTNASLSDVTVLVTDGPNATRRTTTDSAGNYSLANLEQSGFTVRFSRSGYESISRGVTLTQDTLLGITLTRTLPPPPERTVVQPDGSGTTVCRGRTGPEPTALGVPVVELGHDRSNIDVSGTVNLTARPVGPQADVTLRWWLVGRYGTLIASGCTARYVGPESIGTAYQVSVDIYVQKEGYRRAPAFAGGMVHVNIYDQRNLLPPCNAPVTITVGARHGGILRVDLQGVGTFFPVGAPATFRLPVNVRRGLYTLTVTTTGPSPNPRNINVGCPQTIVRFD